LAAAAQVRRRPHVSQAVSMPPERQPEEAPALCGCGCGRAVPPCSGRVPRKYFSEDCRVKAAEARNAARSARVKATGWSVEGFIQELRRAADGPGGDE
jgi:hypothetical protein